MLNFLGRLDQRVLYVLLVLAICGPLLLPVPVPPPALSPQGRGYFDTIEVLAGDPSARNKIVLVSANFGSSTAAESLTQARLTVTHLMKKRLRFALFSFDPQGRELGQQAADEVAARYNYVYGRDYVNWGYRPGDAFESTLKAMVRDIPGTLGSDIRGQPLAAIPVMRGIRSVNDVAAIIEIASADTLEKYLQFFQNTGRAPVPTLYGCTAVMAPEAFPYLKSGQLQGMLVGLKGAVEYETLLGQRGFATNASGALSYSHFLILGLIALGNLGALAGKKGRTAGR